MAATNLAVGIDLGTTYSCVGVFQHGKVEIIANDQGNRTTPSYVAFTDTERLIGDAAKNQVAMNPSNTVFGELVLYFEFSCGAIVPVTPCRLKTPFTACLFYRCQKTDWEKIQGSIGGVRYDALAIQGRWRRKDKSHELAKHRLLFIAQLAEWPHTHTQTNAPPLLRMFF